MIIVAHFEEVGCAETTGRGVQNKRDWRGPCLDPNFRVLSGWGALGLLLLCSWCFLSLALWTGWGQWGSSVELRAVRRHIKRTVAAALVPFVPWPEYHPPSSMSVAAMRLWLSKRIGSRPNEIAAPPTRGRRFRESTEGRRRKAPECGLRRAGKDRLENVSSKLPVVTGIM